MLCDNSSSHGPLQTVRLPNLLDLDLKPRGPGRFHSYAGLPANQQRASERQGRPPDDKLIAALDTGKSWRAVSAATGISFSTMQRHARLLGYSPLVRGREIRH